MLIIAGTLHLEPSDRSGYLAAVADVAVQARQTPGCFDFVQTADPIDAGRINIYERWASDDDLHRFRSSGGPELELPPITSADVHKYRISAVEAP